MVLPTPWFRPPYIAFPRHVVFEMSRDRVTDSSYVHTASQPTKM